MIHLVAVVLFSAVLIAQARSAEGIPGWKLSGSNISDYEIASDQNEPFAGKASGTIRNVKPVPAGDRNIFGTLMQNVKPDHYKGKRVRLSGYFRTRDAGGARLWMRVDGTDHPLRFDNKESAKAAGTQSWRKQEIVLDVPDDAIGIAFGLILEGNGQAWLDDVSLDIVDSSTPSTNMTDTVKVIQEQYARRTAQERAARPGRDYATAGVQLLNGNFEQ